MPIPNSQAEINEMARRHGVAPQAAAAIYQGGWAAGVVEAGSQRGHELATSLETELDLDIYRRAAARRMTLSAYIEDIDRSQPGDPTDAFTRAMYALGIRTSSSSLYGTRASTLQEMRDAGGGRGATLIPELFRRISMTVLEPAYRREILTSSQPGLNSQIVNPRHTTVDLQTGPDFNSILGQITSNEVGLQGTDTEELYEVTYDADELRLHEIGELKCPPTASISSSGSFVTLKGFGRCIEFPGSFLDKPIDLIANWIQNVQLQGAIDLDDWGISVLVNGDGRDSTVLTPTLQSAYGGAEMDTIDLRAIVLWLATCFPCGTNSRFGPTVLLGNAETNAEYLLARCSLAQSCAGIADDLPPMLCSATVPEGMAVAVDGRWAMTRYFRVGQEMEQSDVEKMYKCDIRAVCITTKANFAIRNADARCAMTWKS